MKNAAKGKIDTPASHGGSSAAATHRAQAAAEKKNRINHRNQLRHAHQKTVGQDTKFFSTVSGGKQVPRIVSVIPLHVGLDCKEFATSLVQVLGLDQEEKDQVVGDLEPSGSWLIK